MEDLLRTVPDADLLALAGALRSGRLSAPFSTPAVQRFCAADRATALACRFRGLADEGMRPEHLALLLETVARSRGQRPADSELVELVWTGPEAPGTANRDTGVVVRELFGSAHTSVLVAGYAVYHGREVFLTLAERMEAVPGLKVRLVLDVHRSQGDTSLGGELVARFARRFRQHDWPWRCLPEVFYDPRSLEADTAKRSSMHAKCVVIDGRVAFVSSANFTTAAQQRNVEVGALIRSERFAGLLSRHFETLAAGGLLSRLSM